MEGGGGCGGFFSVEFEIGSWQRKEGGHSGLRLAGSSPMASQILEELFGKCLCLREGDGEQLLLLELE